MLLLRGVPAALDTPAAAFDAGGDDDDGGAEGRSDAATAGTGAGAEETIGVVDAPLASAPSLGAAVPAPAVAVAGGAGRWLAGAGGLGCHAADDGRSRDLDLERLRPAFRLLLLCWL